jgi:hypothetical protein
VTVLRRIGIGMVVVVPALPANNNANDRVVAAEIACFVIAVHRIDSPRYMPNPYQPHRSQADQNARTKLRVFLPDKQADADPSAKSTAHDIRTIFAQLSLASIHR